MVIDLQTQLFVTILRKVTDRSTFTGIKSWMEDLGLIAKKEVTDEIRDSDYSIPTIESSESDEIDDSLFPSFRKPIMVLIGNKIDLPHRQVELEEASAFAENHGMEYFECRSSPIFYSSVY